MRFDRPLVTGALLRRYKRFFVDVALPDGREVTAHCANTGSMRGFLDPGMEVALLDVRDGKRKLDWSLELVRPGTSWVGVNTVRANRIVEEALEARRIAPLRRATAWRREVPYGEGSRVDFLVSDAEGDCYVEVKNVTLAEGRRALFPDAVTARGTKHLNELRAAVAGGARAAMLFLVNRDDCTAVSPADGIDPVYGHTLREAAASGVALWAYKVAIGLEGIHLERKIPVRL